MDNKTTIENRLKILPKKLRVFIVDESWGESAKEIGRQFKLDEKKYINFEDEIFYVLLCFEFKSKFTENIMRELAIEKNLAEQLANEVEKNIFSKVAEELEIVEKQIEENEKAAPQSDQQSPGEVGNSVGPAPRDIAEQSGVGADFEQIIMNQAKAMQPARHAEESDEPTIPTNEIKMPDYSGRTDPYREPTQ